MADRRAGDQQSVRTRSPPPGAAMRAPRLDFGARPEPAPGWTVGGRYRARSLLKQGRGIDTWLGEDVATGSPVVIKTVAASTVPGSIVVQLEHESEVLSRLDSPFLAPLFEVGRNGELLCLVERFVEGETLAVWLARGPLTVGSTLVVARCVLTALGEVHAQGVVHRDVKPSNVIVSGEASLARAVLIDFGLSRSSRLAAALRAEPAGTALYMSPEQAGLIDAEVDPRSDLYSLGILLFECLAGRPPFAGTSITEVLRQHLTSRPPELAQLGVRVPRSLDAVLQRLLMKDPRDRYQSAEGALADVTELERALARGVSEPAVVVGLHDRRPFLTEPAFVGRERELAALTAEVDKVARGMDRGGLLLLESESGGGKTRLLGELAYRIGAQALVLRGQGVAASAQRPFQLLRGVALDLLAAARAEPLLRGLLRERLADAAGAICAVLPDLRDLLGPVDTHALGPEAFGEARTMQALVALLDALGTAAVPALVLLDDVQWADEATLTLLREWQASRDAPSHGGHVLVVASFRSEEVGPLHPLRRLRDVPSVVLSPMSAEAIHAIATSMAGELPEEAVHVLVELAEGSPFMATAVLRGMVESGALVFGEDATWRADPARLADARASRAAAVFLERRLELLPPESLRLLSSGAVLGRDFAVDVAAELSGQTPAAARSAVAEARRRHIVWLRGEGAHGVFAHDKLREAVLAHLPDEERRSHHRRAALHFEQVAPERAFDIAYHFDAAGDSRRAFPYALAAAATARSQYALEIAEQLYRIALRGAPADDAAKRLEVAEGLGEVLMLRGRYAEAVAPFEEARALAAGDELAQARIEGQLGELAFKRGDVQTASAALERGLRILGRFVPRRAVVRLAACAWEVLVQALHTLFPRLFVGRRSPAGATREFLAVHLYSRLAHAYWFQRGRFPTLWAHLREMNLAERYPMTLALAQAYSEHAPVMTMLPYFSRGIAYARRSYEIRRNFGDLWGQGQSLHFLGIVLYAASRFEECIACCRQAVELLDRTGDRWELNTARWNLAYSHYRLGDLHSAVEVAQRVHRSGQEIGDAQARGIGLAIWSKASQGLVPEDLLAEELARPSADAHTRAELLQAKAVRLLRERRAAEAAGVLRDAWRLVQQAALQQEYVAPILPWLATALRTAVEGMDAYTPARRARLLAEASRVGRRAERMARAYRNNLPHALRERGLLFALAGKGRRARRCFDESLAEAERLHMCAEAAETRRTRGRVGALAGSPTAAVDLERGERILGELLRGLAAEADVPDVPATVSLADRFDQILETGRRIASALTREEVLRAVRSAVLTLLRGERCLVVELDPPGDLGGIVLPAETVERPSESVLRLAMASGKPIIIADPAVEDPSESVVLSGARSVLAAPIHVRGQVAFLLYVTHRQVGRLFGEVEGRLAEFITALAGAALENAAGFAETRLLAEERARLYREAQDAVRARDDFLSIAAHELKTPLTALAIQIQSLLRTAQGKTRPVSAEQYASRLGVTRGHLQRFEGLVNTLLDVSRIVNRRIVLQREDVDLADVARDVAARHAEQLGAAGAELRLVAPEAVQGLWDRLRLEQVVTNLLSNAIKFGPGKPIDLEVRKEDGRARLVVRDRGIGIDARDQARIFQRFERAVSLRHYGGLGLGLWITRQIVEAMDGTIRVTSEPGRGSTFTIEMPCRPAVQPAQTGSAPRQAEATTPGRRRTDGTEE